MKTHKEKLIKTIIQCVINSTDSKDDLVCFETLKDHLEFNIHFEESVVKNKFIAWVCSIFKRKRND